MKRNYFPANYKSLLNVLETQRAIKLIKDTFENLLAKELDLVRVSAPLFIEPKTGLNDNLSGHEKPVSFIVNENNQELEIVQSLAKWKRYALKKYEINGLYTDMNAIRRFEELDNLHSLYVDQWDWEKRLLPEERNITTLRKVVEAIYRVFLRTYDLLIEQYPTLANPLPKNIIFITSSELESLFPDQNRMERENLITKKYGAVFLMKIGNKLSDGLPHDSRAADYDDWDLNGDILLWYEPLQTAFELSSMGIRVNKDSLLKQLKVKGEEYKLSLDYHRSIVNGELPLTIGGGIGQSRLCMYLLRKIHIGEVQSSYWPDADIKEFKKHNVDLL
ncbi:MAG TPA: aspartate--ammonia ligase [Erysipelotrichaceae bacterium]|nr:aspartate--ammonia ligase [Erysipelotrichaceae bacterium]